MVVANNNRKGPASLSDVPLSLPHADSDRMLLDIINDEGGDPKNNRKEWWHFKEKLKRHDSGGRGSAWTSSVPFPTSDIPINDDRIASRHSSSSRISPIHDHTNPLNISTVAESLLLARNPRPVMGSDIFDHNSQFPIRRLQREDNLEEEEEERQPVRMSLMLLMVETDDERIGIEGLTYMMEDEDVDLVRWRSVTGFIFGQVVQATAVGYI